MNKEYKISKIQIAYWDICNFINKIIDPIWYRIFGYKHHIVKTKLEPAVWYDSDTRILYAVMAIVEWFVENDMMEHCSKEEYEKEIEEMKKDNNNLFLIESFEHQWNSDEKIMKVYRWWKDYPNRQKEILNAVTNWSKFIETNKTNDGILASVKDEFRQEAERLSEIHNKLEDKLNEEEQEMLKLAIECRGAMWS